MVDAGKEEGVLLPPAISSPHETALACCQHTPNCARDKDLNPISFHSGVQTLRNAHSHVY